MAFRYSVDSLRSLKGNFPILRVLRRKLFYFGILHNNTFQEAIPSRIPVRITRSSTRAFAKQQFSPRLPSVLCTLPREPRHSFSSHYNLTFGLLNVRSLHNKVESILEVQRDRSLDVLFLTETWHDSDSVCIRRLRQLGFSVCDTPRPRSRSDSLGCNHGGVASIAARGVRQTRLAMNTTLSTMEAMCVQLSCKSTVFIALVIYRTGPITSSFFDELCSMLEFLATFSCSVYVVGDLNIHIERSQDPHTLTLLSIFSSFSFSCLVNSSTHDLGGTIDVVFSRNSSTLVCVTALGFSDHCLLSWSAPITKPPPIYNSVSFRPLKNVSISSLRFFLSNCALCDPEAWGSLNVHDLALLYDAIIYEIIDHLAPVQTACLRQRPSDSWFDSDCRSAKRDARRLERVFLRLKRDSSSSSASVSDAFFEWKESCRFYRKLLRHKRESFWNSKVSSEMKSPRDLWSSLNRLLAHRTSSSSSPSPSPQDLHEFFVSKVQSVQEATRVPISSPFLTSTTSSTTFHAFQLVSIDRVIQMVKRLPNKSSSTDPMPCRFLKSCIDLLAPFLVTIFNLSLKSGIFPSPWKRAVITPILKKGKTDPLHTSSYRPISSLPLLSKILEKIVSAQLRSYLECNELLPPLQSAYRTYHSTETALLKITSDIFRALDKGDICLFAFLDLSSAFDTVDHISLLQKLDSSFGFSGSALAWLSSFTCDRSMSVSMNSHSSFRTPVTCGVPQGSVLGPLLFIMYMSDVVSVVTKHNLSIHTFADDIQIYGTCSLSQSSVLSSRLSLCLDDVIAWFSQHRLLLNSDKSEVLWCSSSRKKKSLPTESVRIGSSLIKPSASVRVLGVHIDSCLSFDVHVTRCVSSCFSMLRQIRSIKRSLPRPVLISLVSSLVLSRLDYCISVLCGISHQQLQRLQSVLNASARLIFSASRFSHVSPYLRELRFLPVKARIDLRLSVLVHQCLSGNAPTYLSSDFQKLSDLPSRSSLRSSSSCRVLQPRSRHPTLGGRSFNAASANVWNALPFNCTSAVNISVFKKEVKLHFLKECFSL